MKVRGSHHFAPCPLLLCGMCSVFFSLLPAPIFYVLRILLPVPCSLLLFWHICEGCLAFLEDFYLNSFFLTHLSLWGAFGIFRGMDLRGVVWNMMTGRCVHKTQACSNKTCQLLWIFFSDFEQLCKESYYLDILRLFCCKWRRKLIKFFARAEMCVT